jgi:hypothetical protein
MATLRQVRDLLYPNLANHPAFQSRSRELAVAVETCERYGILLTEADFDSVIADRFGDGVEYEWPKD